MIKCTGKRCPMQVGYDVSKCQCEGCSYRTAPMTNYDRIRNMSVEELTEFLCNNYKCHQCAYYHKDCNGECVDGIKQWLETEVTEE